MPAKFQGIRVGQKVIYHPGDGHPAVQGVITKIRDEEHRVVDVEHPHHADPKITVQTRHSQYGLGVYQWCELRTEVAQLKADNAALSKATIEVDEEPEAEEKPEA